MTLRQNTMIGLTHAPDGRKIIREPKTLKVGIGYPRGKACDVYVDQDGRWIVRSARKGSDGKLKFESLPPIATRAEAEAAFRKAWKAADFCGYPRKVGYFQFTRPVMGDDGVEIYVPDFEAIEIHSFANKNKPGTPTEIDIVFLDDEPYTGGFQMWSASELKCFGDGENALRVLAMASTPEEKELAKAAAAEGKKHFEITNGCWACNCPYSKEGTDGRHPTPAPCKPGADLRFQLSRNIRVGGTAFFHSSSFRTIPQIFSAIERIKDLTGGRIAGIPLKMVVRTHKTNHNNQPAIQNNVAIEFRAEDMEHLRKNLIEQAWKFRGAAGLVEPTALLTAAREDADVVTSIAEDGIASDIANEFYPDFDEEESATAPLVMPSPAATATQQKQDEISRKLQRRKLTVAGVSGKDAPAPVADTQPELRLPWETQEDMESWFQAARDRVSEDAFMEAVKQHGVEPGLAYDDKKAALLYATVRDMPDAKEEGLF